MSASLTVWVRYRHFLGHDREEWSDRGAVTHAVENGRTLCGVVPSGGIQKGWALDAYGLWRPNFVSCQRCRRSLQLPKD
jgi:hypothetical protein